MLTVQLYQNLQINQLADIAYDTSINHSLITGESPKVAFLSFSTNSSANHYRVDKVKRAITYFQKNILA